MGPSMSSGMRPGMSSVAHAVVHAPERAPDHWRAHAMRYITSPVYHELDQAPEHDLGGSCIRAWYLCIMV